MLRATASPGGPWAGQSNQYHGNTDIDVLAKQVFQQSQFTSVDGIHRRRLTPDHHRRRLAQGLIERPDSFAR